MSATQRVVAEPCPLCGQHVREFLFAARDRMHGLPGCFGIWRCGGCGLRSTYPLPADLGRYYPDSYYAYQTPSIPDYGVGWRGTLRSIALRYQFGYIYGAAAARLPAQGPRAQALRMLSRLLRARAALAFGPGPLLPALRGGKALDIGCGSGVWLLKMRALGWQVEGVETSMAACAAARSAGLNVHNGDLATANLPVAAYDLVRLWQALEHMTDPVATLRTVAQLLKPGGRLIIGVPNVGGRLARLWRTYWFDLDAPRHLWHFEARQLGQLAAQTGLRVDALAYGYYGGTLPRCFNYWREERRGISHERRAQLERRMRWLQFAPLAWPLRVLQRRFEHDNYLELTATRVASQ